MFSKLNLDLQIFTEVRIRMISWGNCMKLGKGKGETGIVALSCLGFCFTGFVNFTQQICHSPDVRARSSVS